MKKEQMVSRKHLLWMEDENFQSICVGFFFFCWSHWDPDCKISKMVSSMSCHYHRWCYLLEHQMPVVTIIEGRINLSTDTLNLPKCTWMFSKIRFSSTIKEK